MAQGCDPHQREHSLGRPTRMQFPAKRKPGDSENIVLNLQDEVAVIGEDNPALPPADLCQGGFPLAGQAGKEPCAAPIDYRRAVNQ